MGILQKNWQIFRKMPIFGHMKIIFLIPLCNYCSMATENIIAKFQPKIMRNVGGVVFLVVQESQNV